MTQRASAEPIVIEPPPGLAADAGWCAALAISLLRRTPIVVHFDPGGPGVSAEQLAYARAAAQVCGGELVASVATHSFEFKPSARQPGKHVLELPEGVPAAGVVAMLGPPLALTGGPSELTVRGATHVRGALTFHELALGWAPALERAGVATEVVLDGAGFPGEGIGAIRAKVYPGPHVRPIDVFHRGMILDVHGLACVANVGIGIALPLERHALARLRGRGIAATVEILPMPIERGRGLALAVSAQFEHVRLCLAAVGESGRSPEAVADEAVDALLHLLERRGAVDGRLGALLVLPCALAASSLGAPGAIGQAMRGASRFTVSEVTPELLHAAHVVRRLLDVDVQVQGLPGADGLVDVRPRPGSA